MIPARQPHLHENPDMICASFHRISVVQPENCYNCVHRHGYPQYLFGDEHCDSFVEIRTHTSPPAPASCQTCVDEMAIFCQGCPNLIAHLNGEIKKSVAQHDAQVAKAERERFAETIDELLKIDEPDRLYAVLDNVRQSLRTQQEPSTKGGAR